MPFMKLVRYIAEKTLTHCTPVRSSPICSCCFQNSLPTRSEEMKKTTIYSGTLFERSPELEANPFGKATWLWKSEHKCIDIYPWREAIPLERPNLWHKRGSLTRGVLLYSYYGLNTPRPRSETNVVKKWGPGKLFSSTIYSGTPLVRLLILQQKGGILRGVSSHQG